MRLTTLETRIASGFNRNQMNTHEGGTIPEEYLVEYAADRVSVRIREGAHGRFREVRHFDPADGTKRFITAE